MVLVISNFAFRMPWSPTQAFPHPLANVQSSNTDTSLSNFMSYALVDMLTWQGLGDMINRFRVYDLGLEPISLIWAPGMLHRLRIPWTYCWSPALIPKPKDWLHNISISGFYFLDLRPITPQLLILTCSSTLVLLPFTSGSVRSWSTTRTL